MTRDEEIAGHRLIVETRQLTSASMAQHVLALMRLGVSAFVVVEQSGTRALAYARTVAAHGPTYTLEFEKVRDLAQSEVDALRAVGCGLFESPRPLAKVPHGSAQ